MLDIDSPQPGLSNESTYDVVFSDILEDEPITDPVALAEEERVKSRSAAFKTLISDHFADRDFSVVYVPNRTRTIYESWEAQGVSVDRHELLQKQHSEAISKIASHFGRSNLTEMEVGSCLDSVFTTVDALSPSDKDPGIASKLMDAIESPKDAGQIRDMAVAWTEAFLSDIDPETRRRRIEDFTYVQVRLSGTNIYPRPTALPTELKNEIFAAVSDAYGAGYEHENQDKVTDTLIKMHETMVLQDACDQRDADQARYLTQLFRRAVQEPPEIATAFYSASERYERNHALTPALTDALIANVLPRMRRGDPAVEILQRPGNYGGMGTDDFGLADFVCHSYIHEVTPATLNELLMVLREVPTTNYARLEQNRRDGLRMVEPFGILRDFIHDQRPLVHDALKAMVEYYDTHDAAHLETVLDRTDYLAIPEYKSQILDLAHYDEVIDRTFNGEDPRGPERAIDILRRLEKNTMPVDEAPPEVKDVNLHAALEHVATAPRHEKRKAVRLLTKYMNAKMTDMMDRSAVGVEPSFVEALAWTEQQQFRFLQSMTFEDQVGLAKEEWFKEVLKFHELTHNPDYDEVEFDRFTKSLQPMGDISAARQIVMRVLGQVQQLSGVYTERGKTLWRDSLWSGNVTHEFIGLVDRRPAVTAIGRRLLAEQMA